MNERLQQSESTVTLMLDTWNELQSYILKASSMITVGAQHNSWEPLTLENFMWALSDYIYSAEKIINNVKRNTQ